MATLSLGKQLPEGPVAFRLLPEDGKQALRLKRFFMAALSYVIWIALTFYCWSLGLVDVTRGQFLLAASLCLACNIGFYAVLRSGLNRYWPDPSLTLPQ